MSVTVHSVANGKTAGSEFVWLEVKVASSLHGYAVVDRTFNQQGQLSNEFRHIFVFPDTQVAKGDWVRLYTGTGTYSKTKNDQNTYTHNFYWGSSGCIWNNNGGDTATLIKYGVVNSVAVPAAK